MSLSLRRVSLPRVASVLACAPSLAVLGACHHTSSAREQPSPAQTVADGNGHQSNDERVLRSFPGVDVIRTRSGGVSIRIISALVRGGAPLYIVDGMEMVVDPRHGLDLQPEDIARINVLKGPAETAVYGQRGVNGLIVITTKRAATQRKRGS
jgi:TonB-dependent SusC/RagA subfamily outer membrane receptor